MNNSKNAQRRSVFFLPDKDLMSIRRARVGFPNALESLSERMTDRSSIGGKIEAEIVNKLTILPRSPTVYGP